MRGLISAAVTVAILLLPGLDGGSQPKRTPKEALQAFNDLIGEWRGTGTPAGNKKDFWSEKQEWGWQFKGKDAWLTIAFDKSAHYQSGELRYLPDQDQYQLTLKTNQKE